jgi:hypothetical protein
MSIGDLKPIRTVSDDPLWNLCAGLLFVIALLTAYAMVVDIPERQVVSKTITLTEEELAQIIAAHRTDAAKGVRCDRLQDQFRWTPQKQRQPM